jgi:hypothetical protein
VDSFRLTAVPRRDAAEEVTDRMTTPRKVVLATAGIVALVWAKLNWSILSSDANGIIRLVLCTLFGLLILFRPKANVPNLDVGSPAGALAKEGCSMFVYSSSGRRDPWCTTLGRRHGPHYSPIQVDRPLASALCLSLLGIAP